MNNLSRKILKILEDSPMGDMSVHLLNKQCSDIGASVETLSETDLPLLKERLEKLLPFFIGKSAPVVIDEINILCTECT